MARVFAKASQRFVPTQWPGVEVCTLVDRPGGGGSALFRLRPGATIRWHDHPRGEHTYVVSGRARFGTQEVQAGDVLWTEPGESHEVHAITEVVFVGFAP